MSWLSFFRLLALGLPAVCVLLFAWIVAIAFLNGGSVTVCIDNYGEDWADLALVAVSVPALVYVGAKYVKWVVKEELGA